MGPFPVARQVASGVGFTDLSLVSPELEFEAELNFEEGRKDFAEEGSYSIVGLDSMFLEELFE